MLFTSSVFLFLFLPVVLIAYYALCFRKRVLQNTLLTIASLLFYAWGEPKFVLIMLGSIAANWFFALIIGLRREREKKTRPLLVCSVIVNLGILFVFKYAAFAAAQFEIIFNVTANSALKSIALPIGISFFTFQAMSYVIDVHRGKCAAQKNPLNVALYISLFPQLIAGPIVRYETIADQIQNRRETLAGFAQGAQRFMIGFIKKTLIANNTAIIADMAFDGGAPTAVMAWLGAIAYTIQIYFDFSGYSDMAIGLGGMFGFKFEENFNYPYIARSVSEFWTRWHISLGKWFRDYVYFPLGGSRVKTKARLTFNICAVWILTGIWHGANWTFLLWGGMYTVFILLEKFTGFHKKLGGFGHVYALLVAVLGWVLFRAETIAAAFSYLKAMFGFGASGLASSSDLFWMRNYAFFLIAGIVFSVPVAKKLPRVAVSIGAAILFIVSVTYMIKGSYNPFIYFNF